MYHLLYSPLCIFAVHFPRLAFFFIDRTRKQVLSILVITCYTCFRKSPAIGQLNLQAATATDADRFQNCYLHSKRQTNN